MTEKKQDLSNHKVAEQSLGKRMKSRLGRAQHRDSSPLNIFLGDTSLTRENLADPELIWLRNTSTLSENNLYPTSKQKVTNKNSTNRFPTVGTYTHSETK